MESLVTKVQQTKLSDEVAKSIRDLILSGKLKANDRLPSQIELARLFGVSRSTIRDAINELRGSGFLEIRKPEGTFVLPLTDKVFRNPLVDLIQSEMKNVYDFINIRKTLEAENAFLAAKNANPDELRIMESALLKMEHADQGDFEKLWDQGDSEFHLAIANASQNTIMVHLIDSFSTLMGSLRNTLRLVVDTDEKRNEVLTEHRQIYEAITEKDQDLARHSMIKHMEATIRRIRTVRLIREKETKNGKGKD